MLKVGIPVLQLKECYMTELVQPDMHPPVCMTPNNNKGMGRKEETLLLVSPCVWWGSPPPPIIQTAISTLQNLQEEWKLSRRENIKFKVFALNVVWSPVLHGPPSTARSNLWAESGVALEHHQLWLKLPHSKPTCPKYENQSGNNMFTWHLLLHFYQLVGFSAEKCLQYWDRSVVEILHCNC